MKISEKIPRLLAVAGATVALLAAAPAALAGPGASHDGGCGSKYPNHCHQGHGHQGHQGPGDQGHGHQGHGYDGH